MPRIFSLLSLALLLATGCAPQPAPSEALAASSLDRVPVSADGKRIAFTVSWDAPDEVRTPLRLRNGVPCVPCRVNGREVWAILDTGSERTVLEAETARKCGVRTIPGSVLKAEIGGMNGAETVLGGVPERMAIGAWAWSRMPCLVRTRETRLPSGRTVAFDILGMDVLRAMASYVTLDFRRGEAAFGFRKPYPSAKGEGAAFQWRHGVPEVSLSAAGGRWSAILDTGASSALHLDHATAAAMGLPGARVANDTMVGLGDSRLRATSARATVPHVEIMGHGVDDLDTVIVPEYSKVGTGFLRYFKVTLDLKRSRVWLE